MWRGRSLRAKIAVVSVGVVLPIVAATTWLAVRMARGALQDDLRNSGLVLARELAAAAGAGRPASGSVSPASRSPPSWSNRGRGRAPDAASAPPAAGGSHWHTSAVVARC